MVDNEPANLLAISKIDPQQEIMLLHANTIFETKRRRLPRSSASGKVYDLTELASESTLPRHVQFVWHGVNDRANLRQFLASDVQWGEVDIRGTAGEEKLLLRHDSFEKTPLRDEEELLLLDDALESFKDRGKSIKLDLKENGPTVEKTLEMVSASGIRDGQLWFNGDIERLKEDGFRRLAEAYPSAILQCPVDFVAPIIWAVPDRAKELLDTFRKWGINRFSIKWSPSAAQIFDQLGEWGFDVNIYNVPDLESFLKAVLLLPTSITSDFNFPKWNYYGRGSGQGGEHYEYSIRRDIKVVA
jgi:hypothetical protein